LVTIGVCASSFIAVLPQWLLDDEPSEASRATLSVLAHATF
jgi:hypothetical protein